MAVDRSIVTKNVIKGMLLMSSLTVAPWAKKQMLIGCVLMIAQPVLAVDLIDVYRKALENDPVILGAQYTNRAAEELVNEVSGRLLPQLGFEFTRTRSDQKVNSASGGVFQQTVGKREFFTSDYSLTLTQPLYNRALSQGNEQAKVDQLRADAEFSSSQQDLILRTAERYLETLAASDEVVFAGAEKASVGKQLELVQSMMRGGTARKTELYDAQARYASVEADEISAISVQDDKLQALKEMAGDLSSEPAKLKKTLMLIQPQPNDPESWMQAAVKQNPRVVQLSHAVEVSRHEIELQQSGHAPTLDLTARMNRRDAGGGISGASDVETSDILLRLSVPIYQGNIVNSRTRRSQQLHQKALMDLTEMQRAVQRSARAAYYGVISAISKVAALEKSVRSQELALNSKQRGYRSGLYTSLDVLDAERDAYEARRDHARSRYEYLLNSLRLKYAVGTLNVSDLENINNWLQDS